MRTCVTVALLAAAMVASCGCHRNEVRLPVSPVADDYVWRTRINPEEYMSRIDALMLPINPPTGYAEARESPPEEFVMSTHLDWNRMIEHLRDEFSRLIRQHNQGAISVERFEPRMDKLQEALDRMQSAREAIAEDLVQYRKVRDEWYSQRWQIGEAAEQKRKETRTRIETLRVSVQNVLKDISRMIERLQGAEPAPDILVKR